MIHATAEQQPRKAYVHVRKTKAWKANTQERRRAKTNSGETATKQHVAVQKGTTKNWKTTKPTKIFKQRKKTSKNESDEIQEESSYGTTAKELYLNFTRILCVYILRI